MADDTLVIGSEFDPTGILQGLNVSKAKLVEFERTVSQVSSALPGLDQKEFMAGVQEGLKDVAAAAKTTTSATNQMAHGFEVGRSGGRRLESALTGIALSATGVTGPVTRVLEGLIQFGAANVDMLELAASIGVVVAAYELLTTATRTARAEQDKLLKAQRERLKDVGDPTGLTRTVEEGQKRILAITKEIDDWTRAITVDAAHGLITIGEELKLRRLLKEARQLELAVQLDQAAVEQRHSDLIFETLQRQKDQRLSSLEAAPALGTARPSDMAAIRTEMALQLQIIRAQGVALVDRNEAMQTYDALRTALHFKELTFAAAEFDAIERSKQAYKDLLSTLDRLATEAEKQTRASPGNVQAKALLDQLARRLPADAAQAKRFTDSLSKGFEDTQARMQAVGQAFDDLDRHLQQTNVFWRKATKEVEDHRTAEEKLHDAIAGIADGLAGLTATAAQVGLISDQAAQAITSVVQLGQALNDIALIGLTTGNIFGVIGAGISLIGGLASGGPSEHERLLKENNDRLADLKASLDASILGAGQFASPAAGLLGSIPQFPSHPGSKLSGGGIDQAGFEQELAAAGLTIEQWAAEIQQITGFDVLDDAGHLIAERLDAASKALDILREAATHFGTSLADIENQIAVHAKLFGGSDLGQNRDVLIAGLNLPDFEARLAALDLETEAGRKAYLEYLKQLYNLAKAGAITAEQLGKFASVDDLLDSLGQGADDVNQANQDAADAAREKAQADKDAADAAKELADQQRAAMEALGNQTTTLLGLRDKLTGVTNPMDLFRSQIIGLGVGSEGFLPKLLETFGTVNFDTPELRDSLKQMLVNWIDAMTSGALKPEDLGLTQDQFTQFLEEAAQALQDFDSATAEAAKAAADAAKAQRDQAREMESLHSRLVGDPQDAVRNFQRELDILSQSIPELSGAFDGLDLTSAGNAEAIRRKLLELFDQVGNIDPALKDEFLNFLGLGADALDELTKSANDATKSLSNVPQGLNFAEFEWRARMAAPPGRGSDGAQLPVLSPSMPQGSPIQRGGGTQMLLGGAVTININGSNLSPREIAQQVTRELERVGMARRGVPSGTTGLG